MSRSCAWRYALAWMAASVTAGALVAQDEAERGVDGGTSIERTSLPLWEAVLPGGIYTVNLERIDVVAWHRYQVDGAVDVHEVTVDASGSTVGRFYYVAPSGAESPVGVGQSLLESMQERARQLAERTGQGELLDNTVLKSYPTTTHAKTIEYRLGDLEQLRALYHDLRRHWLLGRKGRFQVQAD